MQSKILEYLQIPDSVSDGFPQDVKDFVEIIDGSQLIYSESKDSVKREKLAELIVQWMRELMKFLQTQNLGIYATSNVQIEHQALPNQPEPPQQNEPRNEPKEPKPKKPKSQPPAPPQPPTPPTPPSPPEPEPEPEPPYSKEELEEAIATQEILFELTGDEADEKELRQLKALYQQFYS
jgi:outer membrane biosynthesis protein TonB